MVGSVHFIYLLLLWFQAIFSLPSESGGGYSRFSPFLINKAKRLIVPYVFAMMIWVAPISAYFFHWDTSYLVKKYLLCIDPSQLWFLWMLFGVFAISWPLWKVFSENRLLGAVIALAFYCLGILGNMVLPNVFCIWTACQYVCFFYIGIRLRCEQGEKHWWNVESLPWWGWIIVDILLYVFYVEVSDLNGIIAGILGAGIGFLLHAFGAVMAFAVLQKMAERVHWEKSAWFGVLSSYSMPMYLFHQQIMYFSLIWLNGRVNPWINAAANFTFALTVSLLLSWALMKFKFTRFLIGEK